MFKVLAAKILARETDDAADRARTAQSRRVVRGELEDLFHDDFAAHALIVKSRKAARAAGTQYA